MLADISMATPSLAEIMRLHPEVRRAAVDAEHHEWTDWELEDGNARTSCDRFWCWCLGHRWVPRTFHDGHAHDFVVCTRCGKVSGPEAEGRRRFGR